MRDRSSLFEKIARFPADLAGRGAGGGRVGTEQQHLSMFVLSHLCGPLIGLALSLFLMVLGFPIDWRLSGFTALVCLFWVYPAALAIGVPYRLLSLASLQHLTLVILWASHAYGGLTSPFLLWLAIVPLLAFLYSAPRIRLWLVLLLMLVLNTGLFAAVTLWLVPPPEVPQGALRWLAALSLLSASVYVWMMAGYFGRVLSSRNELAQEVARRRVLIAQLDRRATSLRHLRAAKTATLARLVHVCRQPVGEMLDNSHSGSPGADPASSSATSDLLCIEEAAKRLAAILARIEAFTGNLPRGGSNANAGRPERERSEAERLPFELSPPCKRMPRFGTATGSKESGGWRKR